MPPCPLLGAVALLSTDSSSGCANFVFMSSSSTKTSNLNPCWRGSQVDTLWSSNVVVERVLCIFQTATVVFYGVEVENQDFNLRDYPRKTELLWVFADGNKINVWMESRQRPQIVGGELQEKVEHIVGHFQDESGEIYYAVKWAGYECPTWELESDLHTCSDITTRYCKGLASVLASEHLLY